MSGYGVSIKKISVNTLEKRSNFSKLTQFCIHVHEKKRWMPFVTFFVVNIVQNAPDGLCFVFKKKNK